MKVAVVPAGLRLTAPATGVPPGPLREKLAVVSEAASIWRLKVALTVVVTGTAVAAFAGTVLFTVKIVPLTMGPVPVVKLQLTVAGSGVPVALRTPVVRAAE